MKVDEQPFVVIRGEITKLVAAQKGETLLGVPVEHWKRAVGIFGDFEGWEGREWFAW